MPKTARKSKSILPNPLINSKAWWESRIPPPVAPQPFPSANTLQIKFK